MFIKHQNAQAWENDPGENNHTSTYLETTMTAPLKTLSGFCKHEGWLERGVEAGVVRGAFQRKWCLSEDSRIRVILKG